MIRLWFARLYFSNGWCNAYYYWWILASFSWRYVFLVYGSGIFIFIFCLFYLFEPRSAKKYIQEKPLEKINYKPFLPIYFMEFFIMLIYYLSGINFSTLHRKFRT